MCVLFSSSFFFSSVHLVLSYQGFPSESFYLRGHNISTDSYFTGYGVIVAARLCACVCYFLLFFFLFSSVHLVLFNVLSGFSLRNLFKGT